MKVSQSEDLMVIRETPGCLWLFAGFFVFVSSVFVYGSMGGFTNYSETPAWVIVLSFAMGMIGLGVGVWQIAESPVTKVTIDRKSGTVEYFQVGLRGRIKTVYGFDQVRQFRMV